MNPLSQAYKVQNLSKTEFVAGKFVGTFILTAIVVFLILKQT